MNTGVIQSTIKIVFADDITDKMALIGRAITLMLDSHIYLPDTLYIIKKNLVSPVFKNQALIGIRDGKVVGYLSWAFLSEEAEARYIADSNCLDIPDWNSGDRIWLIDVVAPLGDAGAMLAEVRKQADLHGLRGKKVKFKKYDENNEFQIREVRL